MSRIGRSVHVSSPGANSATYDAFISYSHADRAAAMGIQKALYGIGRRPGHPPALRVFRDATHSTAGPDLKGKVTAALDCSRFLIVVLSPASATSKWVNLELDHWLERSGSSRVQFVVASGRVVWDEASQCFDPELSTCAPRALTQAGVLEHEPLYLDVSQDSPWSPSDRVFREKITDLAAPIHGKPKAELAGDDRREQLRSRRFRRGAVAALIVATITSVIATLFALAQKQQAELQRNEALALSLASAARSNIEDSPALALAQAAESTGVTSEPLILASSALVDARAAFENLPWVVAALPVKDHDGPVTAVDFSPDGRTLASASQDGTLVVREPVTGSAATTRQADGVGLLSTAFGPGGTDLVTLGSDLGLVAWTMPDLKRVASTAPVKRPSIPLSFAFDGAGEWIASAGRSSAGGEVWLLDSQTAKPLGEPIQVGPSQVDVVAIAPDGESLATASNWTVQLWDAESKEALGEPLPTDSFVWDLEFSPTQNILAGATGLGVGLWDSHTGASRGLLEGHVLGPRVVAFSADGRTLVSGGSDGTVRLWDIESQAPIGAPLVTGGGGVTSLVFGPDGTQLAAGCEDGSIQIWSKRAEARPLGHGKAVKSVGFSPDGGSFASAGLDGTVKVWDSQSAEPRLTIRPPGREPVPMSALTFAGDGLSMASIGWGGSIWIWDSMSGIPISRPLDFRNAEQLAFSSDSTELLAVAFTGEARAWDLSTGLVRRELEIPGLPLPLQPSSTQIAVHEDAGRIGLWDWRVGADPTSIVAIEASRVDPSDVTALAWDPSAAGMVMGFSDGTFQEFSTENGSALGPLREGHQEAVSAIALDPTGRLLATGGRDGKVQLWVRGEDEPLGLPLVGHQGPVNSLSFSPSGDRLVSGGADGMVKTWDYWSVKAACDLASPLVSLQEIRADAASSWNPTVCWQ